MIDYLIKIITEGVWAMAPIMLQAQMTHRKVRKASWQPGLGHFPGTAVAWSLSLDTHQQPVRFCQQEKRFKIPAYTCSEAPILAHVQTRMRSHTQEMQYELQ